MEKNSGIQKLLGNAAVYRMFQSLVGADFAAKWLSEHLWKVEPGMRVVDVGCGPASLRKTLPESITYYGFDPNRDYIETARRTADGIFTAGVMPDFLREHSDLAGTIDVVICTGVLHHLTPGQMNEVLSGARALLREGGRFSALEPTWLMNQDRWSKWVLSLDRGKNILFDHEWRAAISEAFETVDVRVVNSLIRIPYTYVLINAWKGTPPFSAGR